MNFVEEYTQAVSRETSISDVVKYTNKFFKSFDRPNAPAQERLSIKSCESAIIDIFKNTVTGLYNEALSKNHGMGGHRSISSVRGENGRTKTLDVTLLSKKIEFLEGESRNSSQDNIIMQEYNDSLDKKNPYLDPY